ncbi:MAG: TRAM domain-containing protein [Acidobacteria bacterium]|nr:TRAM domain-containing protein [Acidobacteriota bacterium]
MTGYFLFRLLLIALLAAAGMTHSPYAAAIGAAIGLAVIVVEVRLRAVAIDRLIGGSVGALSGLVGAALVAPLIPAFLQLALLLSFFYLGAMIGLRRGPAQAAQGRMKILDTSVIIDGRIADLAKTGFIEGTLLTPQFVLRELQSIADSADAQRRNRGRRGLDILQEMRKNPDIAVRVVDDDFPNIDEVDRKLVELAKRYGCPVLTNDFNLNKVATIHGITVLNINELAGALRPLVLPGETMKVFIQKEGKEANQGVAYLDDGTMVVVDNAKKLISRTVEVTVTSVLQTAAGKMIFARFDERS